MEKVYKLEDSVRREIEYLPETYIISGAEFWAERMNEEREEGDSEFIVTDVESAIDVYESASIWVKEVKAENHKTTCLACDTTDEMTFVFGTDERYPDDVEINCTRCDNWESGTLKNLGTFKMEVV